MEKEQFAIIENRTKVIPVMKEVKLTGKKFIGYGEDNAYPRYLFSLYENSTILQSIINGIVDYAVGHGVTCGFLSDAVNADGETWDDILKNITTDYMVTNGFALNVLRDAENRISEIYWLDICNVRLSADGLTGFYSETGFSWGDKPQELPIFDPKKKQKSSIFYYKGNSRGLYPVPRWSGAITAAETSVEIARYHLNQILNNFNPSAIISFNNGVPDKETQEAIEKKINKKFVGSENVNRFILSFSESGENQTTVQTLGTDRADEKFHTLKDSIQEELFISFRATPALFGMNPENTGFSKTEFLESFALFSKTVIEPIQNTLNKAFGKILDSDKPLSFNKFEVWNESIAVVKEETTDTTVA